MKAGAEHATRAREHHHAHRRVGRDLRAMVLQRVQVLGVQPVQVRGTVQRDRGNAIGHGKQR
jgi:hypothetical protein